MKRLFRVALACMVILVGAPVILPRVCMPWSRLNAEEQDINIKAGRKRTVRFWWYLEISATETDTVLSRDLSGTRIDVANCDEWQHVNIFSPGLNHSPHFIYHGAFASLQQLEMTYSLCHPAPQQRETIARQILTLWQTAGNDRAADDFIQQACAELMTTKNYPEDSRIKK